jgi:hypothetical protein
MTGLELITRLKVKGFPLFLSGEGVGYRYTRMGEPDKNQVIPILEELRQKRDEVRRLLISEEPEPKDLNRYEEVFRLALAGIIPLDPQGTALQKIQKIPEIWNPIQEAEDEINRLWKAAQKGRMVWQEYCRAVETWRERFSKGIKNYLP